MNFDHNSIEMLEKKITFWTSKLNSTRDCVEAAELSAKINETKKQIRQLKAGESKKSFSTPLDTPTIADKLENNQILRGSVFCSEVRVEI